MPRKKSVHRETAFVRLPEGTSARLRAVGEPLGLNLSDVARMCILEHLRVLERRHAAGRLEPHV